MKKGELIAAVLTLAMMAGVIYAFTYDFNTATPPDTGEAPGNGADRIREVKEAVQERLHNNMFFPLTGTQVSNADAGKFMHVEFTDQDSSAAADGGSDDTHTADTNEGILDIIDYDIDADGDGTGEGTDYRELTWWDEQGNSLQITNNGKLLVAGTYPHELNLSNTGNSLYADVVACTDGGYLTLPHDSTDTTEGNLRYMADSDVETITYRTDDAWLTLLTSTTSGACQIKIGTYSGDAAATQAITGVGFQPDAVMVMPLVDDRDIFIKTAGMVTTYSKSFAGNANDYLDDSITALGADGFTVGDGSDRAGAQDHLNETGTNNYAYIAVRTMD